MDFKALIRDQLSTTPYTLKLSFCYVVINYALNRNNLLVKYLIRSTEPKMLDVAVLNKLKTELQKKKARFVADNEIVVGRHHYKLKTLAAGTAGDNLLVFSDRDSGNGLKVRTYIGSRDELISAEEEMVLGHLHAEIICYLSSVNTSKMLPFKDGKASKDGSGHSLLSGPLAVALKDTDVDGDSVTNSSNIIRISTIINNISNINSLDSSNSFDGNNGSSGDNNGSSDDNNNRGVCVERNNTNSLAGCNFIVTKHGNELIASPVPNCTDVNSNPVQYVWECSRPEVIVKMWRQQPLLEYHHVITADHTIRLIKLVLLPVAEDLTASGSEVSKFEVLLSN